MSCHFSICKRFICVFRVRVHTRVTAVLRKMSSPFTGWLQGDEYELV